MGSLEHGDGHMETFSKKELLEQLTFPGYWPPALPDMMLNFIAGRYNPETMPKLVLVRPKEDPSRLHVIGWGEQDTEPNLVHAVRGFGLTDKELAVTKVWPNVRWCPRCQKDAYVPYPSGEEDLSGEAVDRQAAYDEGFTPPALSRMDNETYICSACGQDEAMRDMYGAPPVPPNEWPIGDPGFGVGVNQPVMGLRGPYGTNEGDTWLGTGSDVQARLDAEGNGMQLVHEIIDGEEKVYVTADAELIDRARIGTIRYLEDQGRRN